MPEQNIVKPFGINYQLMRNYGISQWRMEWVFEK